MEQLAFRCRDLDLPVIGVAAPEIGGGLVVKLSITSKRLIPLVQEGYRVIPSGTRHVLVQEPVKEPADG